MKVYDPNILIGGWFIGDFVESVFKTSEFEVAYKTHLAGDDLSAHYHSVATEINYLISGTIDVNGQTIIGPMIYVHPPGETAYITVVTDVTMIVVKTPSIIGDKYMVDSQ